MKTHVFRDVNYLPSPVTSICSNNETIAVFRRCKTLDLLDSVSNRMLLRLDFGYTVTKSFYIDKNTIISLSECNTIIITDIVTLEKQIYDVCATNLHAIYHDVAFAERNFVYSTTKNEVVEMRNGKSTILFKESSQISTLFTMPGLIVLGTKDGWIKTSKNGKYISEINVKSQPNQIIFHSGDDFVAVLENGSCIIFNIDVSVVFDSVYIRSTPLNVVTFHMDFLHISGVDSRIISYAVINHKLSKVFQSDFHTSEVLCMAADRDRILTAGEDALIVANYVLETKYTPVRIFDSSVCCGSSKDYFFVATDAALNLYRLGEQKDPKIVSVKNSFSEQSLFKISESVLEKINQQETDYTNFLKFNINKVITSASVSYDQSYLAYSTIDNTYLYTLFTGSKLSINLAKEFPGAKESFFYKKYFVMVNVEKQVVVFDLEKFETKIELNYDDYRESVVINDKGILFTHLKQFVDFETQSTTVLPSELPIISASGCGDEFYLLSVKEANKFSFSVLNGPVMTKEVDLNSCTEMKGVVDGNFVYGNRHLIWMNENGLGKYDFKNIIHGVFKLGDDLMVVQSCWTYLESKYKPSVFKEKYSNK